MKWETLSSSVRDRWGRGLRALFQASREPRPPKLVLPGVVGVAADREGPAEGDVARAIPLQERLEIERWGLERREAALLGGRFVFEAGPHEAHVCFNNYCNMSCIMCWNGANPPVVKMAPELIARFEQQIAPWLSVMTPYDGSEPLVAGWQTTRTIAERLTIELCLTTNVEYLDERRFRELQNITETLYLSIDSHLPDVFERIRPGSKPEKVFANLPGAIALANQHGIECQANVVFMTLNAPHLHETVAFLADLGVPAVHVLQMLDVNGKSSPWNPLVQLSAEELGAIKEKCLATAREKRIRLVWDVAGIEDHDFRVKRIGPTARKAAYDHWDWRMKHLLPGYCRFVRDRLRIGVDGSVAACSFSTDGELELGNLARDDFADMWNGAKLRDLRRAHLTRDLPAICASCRFADPLPPSSELPFTRQFLKSVSADPDAVPRTLEVTDPAHLYRHESAPTFQVTGPGPRDARYLLVLARGGEEEHAVTHALKPTFDASGGLRFRMPRRLWRALEPNLGYWWDLIACDPATGAPLARSTEIRCLIRRKPIPRIPESGLRYADQGHLSVIDLGSAHPEGRSTDAPRERPPLAARRFDSPWSDPRNPEA